MRAAGDNHREDPIDPAQIRMVATVIVGGYREAALAYTRVIERERGVSPYTTALRDEVKRQIAASGLADAHSKARA